MKRTSSFWIGVIWKSLRSLRLRIFLIVLLSGVLPCAVMSRGIVRNYERRAVSVRISDVQAQLKILANHLITYNYLQNPSSEVIDAELNQLSGLYDGRVMIVAGNYRIRKDTYGISEGKYMISEEIVRCFKNGESASNYDREDGYIELTTPIVQRNTEGAEENAKEEEVAGVMLTSVSTDYIATTMTMLQRTALILEIVTTLLVFALAAGLSVTLVKPIHQIIGAIGSVKEGYSDEPVRVKSWTEMEDIADAFNRMLDRMNTLNESRQEFVANVSHELKTPLTSMKVLSDSLLADENASLEMYREFMADVASEIDRENSIINDLLSLVKMDKKEAELNISATDVNAMLELILKRLRPIARKQDVELIFESIRPVNAAIDEVKLTLAVTNLVENAIKYNKEHGIVKVRLDADHQFFYIDVSDTGIGIPEEARAHIYERFYRVDKSHSREIGGTGLGLSITYNAILMHRGTIDLESAEGEGSTFHVKIPLNYIPAG